MLNKLKILEITIDLELERIIVNSLIGDKRVELELDTNEIGLFIEENLDMQRVNSLIQVILNTAYEDTTLIEKIKGMKNVSKGEYVKIAYNVDTRASVIKIEKIIENKKQFIDLLAS